MLFNEKGECTQLTVGYVMDKQIGGGDGKAERTRACAVHSRVAHTPAS